MIALMERAARILTSAGFVAGLIVLLANDFVLKQAYPGVLTGKLSDFAGLFIFPMFWAAFRPRWSREIYVATALAFMWWKSPWSQGAIDGWNALELWDVGRVVDWTDLAALAVLPLSYAYCSTGRGRFSAAMNRRVLPAVVLVSALAFTGTTCGGGVYDLTPYDPATTYHLKIPFEEFPSRLDGTGLRHKLATGYVAIGDGCRYASILARPSGSGTIVSLIQLGTRSNCDGALDDEGELRRSFEEGVVRRLTGDTPGYSMYSEPEGARLDYDEPMRRELDIPILELARIIDVYPEPHHLNDDVYHQDLGLGYFVRFRAVPRGHLTIIEVLGYINRDGGEESPEEMQPRFQYYLDYVLGHASAGTIAGP